MNEVGGGTFVIDDPDLKEAPKSEKERIEHQITQVEEDLRYFENLPPISEVLEQMDEDEIQRFQSENPNLDLSSDWIFSHEDIERGIRYSVVGDDGFENEGPNYQDRLGFVNIAIPRELVVDGRKLGFTVGRAQIMAETAEAAKEKLARLKDKLSEFEVEDMSKAA